MKTLRKLAAIFCALGMLVPSVAMATFGSTFGVPSYRSYEFSTGSTAWASGVGGHSPIKCFHQKTDSTSSSIMGNCLEISNVGSQTWIQQHKRIVSKGWVAGLDCMFARNLPDADASTELTLALYFRPSGQANWNESSVEPLQIGSDWVICDGDCDTVLDNSFHTIISAKGSIVGASIPDNGFVAFGIKTWVIGAASVTFTALDCTLVVGS